MAKSFGRKYVEFASPASHVKLALYERRALAKDAGVSPDGTGSHRIAIGMRRRALHRPGRIRLGGRDARSRVLTSQRSLGARDMPVIPLTAWLHQRPAGLPAGR